MASTVDLVHAHLAKVELALPLVPRASGNSHADLHQPPSPADGVVCVMSPRREVVWNTVPQIEQIGVGVEVQHAEVPRLIAAGDERFDRFWAREDELQANSKAVGAALLQRLQSLKQKYRIIGDVRGVGLMLALANRTNPEIVEAQRLVRSGAIGPMPPIWIAIDEKLAKPHSA